jgi:aspartate 1-decarboxylase
VMVADLSGGARLWTYVIRTEPGSGTISMNGAAAHLIRENHKIIIFSWVALEESEIEGFAPQIVFIGENNEITGVKSGEINAPVTP